MTSVGLFIYLMLMSLIKMFKKFDLFHPALQCSLRLQNILNYISTSDKVSGSSYSLSSVEIVPSVWSFSFQDLLTEANISHDIGVTRSNLQEKDQACPGHL